jgi:hypothetical protein
VKANLDYGTIALIVTFALSIAASVAGATFKLGKDKVTKLLCNVIDAVQDDKVTEEECQKIAAEAKELVSG